MWPTMLCTTAEVPAQQVDETVEVGRSGAVNLATFDCERGVATGEIFPDDFRFGPTTKTDDFVCWSLERFKGWRTVLTTSFGMEGCALIDIYARRAAELEV